MDGGAWWAAVHGVAKSQTRLSDFTFTLHFHALVVKQFFQEHQVSGTTGISPHPQLLGCKSSL